MREREDIPIMLLGLKRDLREEKAGVIYPQEVGCTVFVSRSVFWRPVMAPPELRC